jgi:hypothetical protein
MDQQPVTTNIWRFDMRPLFVLIIALIMHVFHIGEIKGVTSMKNTRLFQEHIDKPYGT